MYECSIYSIVGLPIENGYIRFGFGTILAHSLSMFTLVWIPICVLYRVIS